MHSVDGVNADILWRHKGKTFLFFVWLLLCKHGLRFCNDTTARLVELIFIAGSNTEQQINHRIQYTQTYTICTDNIHHTAQKNKVLKLSELRLQSREDNDGCQRLFKVHNALRKKLFLKWVVQTDVPDCYRWCEDAFDDGCIERD